MEVVGGGIVQRWQRKENEVKYERQEAGRLAGGVAERCVRQVQGPPFWPHRKQGSQGKAPE